jgi:hypothetical protein
VVDIKFWMYLIYLTRNGLVFLEDVFDDDRLARAVNRLLVVGFYLINLGYVSIALRTDRRLDAPSAALEELSRKMGLVLLVLGALHFFNVYALSRYRRTRLRQNAPHPPLPPAGRLPTVGPLGPAYPPAGGPGFGPGGPVEPPPARPAT